MVPPLYEEGPLQRRSRSSLRSDLEIWPHVKIDDSYTFWKDFGFLENNSRGLFGVCFGHASQGRPKGCPKAPKRCSMISPKVPKGHPKGPQTHPTDPRHPVMFSKCTPRPPQRRPMITKRVLKVISSRPKAAPKSPKGNPKAPKS